MTVTVCTCTDVIVTGRGQLEPAAGPPWPLLDDATVGVPGNSAEESSICPLDV